jgi:transmembrane sensor
MSTPDHKQINTEAAEWLIRLEDIERPLRTRQQTDFFAWLRRSPTHLRAFLETADLWRGLEHFDPQQDIDLDKLLAARFTQITALAPRRNRPTVNAPATRAQQTIDFVAQRRWWLAAALGCALIGWQTLRATDSYSTALGEQRTLRLADGSILQLNTGSRVTLRYSGAQRLIELQQGEALFTVAPDAGRPFIVQTDSARIQALGTQFNVRQTDRATTVTVVEGSVQVSRPAVAPARLLAGDEARVAAGKLTTQRARDVGAAVAWRERRLVFDSVPLAQVTAEFNRYNSTQIRVTGDIGQTKRITGIFSADHPQSLILFLRKELGVRVEERADLIVVSAE